MPSCIEDFFDSLFFNFDVGHSSSLKSFSNGLIACFTVILEVLMWAVCFVPGWEKEK